MTRRDYLQTVIRDVIAIHKLIDGVCDPRGKRCGWKGPAGKHADHLAAMIADRLEGLV